MFFIWILLTVFLSSRDTPDVTSVYHLCKRYIKAVKLSRGLRCGLLVYRCLPCALLAPPVQVTASCAAPLCVWKSWASSIFQVSLPPDSEPPVPKSHSTSSKIPSALTLPSNRYPTYWAPWTWYNVKELTVPWMHFIGLFNIGLGGSLFEFPLLRFPPFSFPLCAQSISPG